jgi:hypothetical protein
MIEGDHNILNYTTCFYKDLFGFVEFSPVSLNSPLTLDLNEMDWDLLTRFFTLEEIKKRCFLNGS